MRNDSITLYRFHNPLPPTVVVDETTQATRTVEFPEAVGGVVEATASVGSVVEDGENPGSWLWTYTPTDGPDQSQTVTITATDSEGGQSEVSFKLTVWNTRPQIALTGTSTLEVNDGGHASNSGIFSDLGADIVSVTSSVGTIQQTGTQNGEWSWSWTAAGSGSKNVYITATDSDGAQSTTVFTVQIANGPPVVAVTGTATVTVNEGAQAVKAGTFIDQGGDTVTITASIGSVSKNGTSTGTWSWSFNTTDGPDQNQTVTITATDSQGAQSSTTFDLIVNNLAPP